MEQKTSSYKFKDSTHMYLYAILAPQIMVLIFIGIFSIISNLTGVEYEILLSGTVARYVSVFLAQVGFLIAYFLYQKLKKIDWKKASHITKKINLKQIAILILIAGVSLFFFSPLINFLDYLISLTGYSASSELPIDLGTVGGLIIGLVALSFLPAVAEELIFRGVVFGGLKKIGYKKAIIISSLLFALMHASIQQTFYQFIIGVILAYAFYITGSLLASMTIHFANNAIIIIISFVAAINNIETSAAPTFNFATDFIQLISYTAIGIALLVFLFSKLKEETQKQKNKKQETVEEIVIETEESSVPEEKEFLSRETVSNIKILFLAIVIGVAFWIADLLLYLT